MAFKRTDLLAKIADGLGAIKYSCEQRGIISLFDNHRVAQHFFCRLLNTVYDLNLVELDHLKDNFPSIDLGDTTKRISFQVTSQKTSDKVTKTLEKFVQYNLDQKFDSVKVLIIGDRQTTYGAVEIPLGLKFSTDDDILDISTLLKHINTFGTEQLEAVQKILIEEVTSPFRLSPSARGMAGLAIDIGVVRDPPPHSDPSDKFTDDRILRYVTSTEKSGEDVTVVSPQMGYLSQMGKTPLAAIKFFWNPFKCQYPCLDVTFVNNTGATLVVKEAVFEVIESVPDLSPVIVIKDENARMQLVIENEGWGCVCNPRIRCNILPTGQSDRRPDPSIDHVPVSEPFAHNFQLTDFEEQATLELEETFGNLGVQLNVIREAGLIGQGRATFHAMQNGLDLEEWQHYGRFPRLDTSEAWAGFPDGYAVIAGVLDYNDELGVAYSVPFRVRVFLFAPKMNLPMPPSFTYHVMLEPEGKKYEVPCAAVHSLQNGEADRILIRVGCLRSATHMFRIKWRLSGGNELVSQLIRLRHFVPRRWAFQRRDHAEVGQADEPQLPPPESQVGCVEAAIRTAVGMANAVAQAKQSAAIQTVGYFAYGSNMYLPHLQQKAKSARPVGPLEIPGFQLRFEKLSEDGSAQCNMAQTGNEEDVVAGVVFEINADEMASLNSAETGYELMQFGFRTPEGGEVRLLTHAASEGSTAEGIRPHAWYKDFILQGARMFGFPEEYIEVNILSVQADDQVAEPKID